MAREPPLSLAHSKVGRERAGEVRRIIPHTVRCLAALLALAVSPAAPASPQPSGSGLPWRSHTALVDDGGVDYALRVRDARFAATLGDAIDLAIAPAGRAPAFDRAGIPVALTLDVNRCSGTRGAAAFGYAQPAGADDAAVPDCSDRDRWRDNAFYRAGGDVLFEPTEGGGVFGALGNPASAPFRRAASAAMRELLTSAAGATVAALYLRDVASPDEIGLACVSAEGPEAAFSCADTDDVSSADGATRWLGGELELARTAPRPVYLDGLASNDADPAGTHHAMAETARLASGANVAGAACDDCFYAGDFSSLAYQERSAMAVTAARKRVIVIDEGPHGSPRFHATPPRARLSALAAVALFYEYDTTYLASHSCGPVSGIAVCPEATVVFRDPETTVTDPEKLRDAGGAYRRAFRSCAIGGVEYGACVALVDAKPYAVLATGLAAAPDAPAAGPGFALVAHGLALPTGFGDVAGTLAFHPLGADEIDAGSGRVKLAAQSGTILFASATPKR